MATATKSNARETRAQAERTGAQAEHAAESAQRTAEQAQLTLQSALRDAGYAMVGAGDYAVAAVRNLGKVTAELPHQARAFVEQTPEMLRTVSANGAESVRVGFEDLSTRGRQLAGRIRLRSDVQEAAQQTRAAKSQVKAATTSVGKAANAQVEAAADTAQVVGESTPVTSAPAAPAPTAPTPAAPAAPRRANTRYEERTLDELQELAAERNIEGRSLLTKDQLIAALRRV